MAFYQRENIPVGHNMDNIGWFQLGADFQIMRAVMLVLQPDVNKPDLKERLSENIRVLNSLVGQIRSGHYRKDQLNFLDGASDIIYKEYLNIVKLHNMEGMDEEEDEVDR